MEVCYNEIYHPVCDEGWTDSDAAVTCNSIGYGYPYYREYSLKSLHEERSLTHSPTGSEATRGMVFGLSDKPPILQNLMCNGSEYTLRECTGYDLNGVSGEYCLSGYYQAGVRCIESIAIKVHIDTRILLICILQRLYLVMMVMFAWVILLIPTLMDTTSMEVEWKCAIMAPTVQCVMMVGLTVTLLSSVTTLVMAIRTIVSNYLIA